jgi:uncharacterized protein (TIGR02265 family)
VPNHDLTGSPPTPAPAPTTQQALIFSQTVEGLVRTLGVLTPEARLKMKAIGFDLARPLLPAYPVEQWLQLMRLAAELHAPEQPIDEALTSLGRQFVAGYGETMLGKMLLVVLRMVGPRRALERFSHHLSTGSNFFVSSLTRGPSGDWVLWINRVTWPGWYVGLIESGLEHAGGRNVSVSVIDHEGPGRGARLRVAWDDKAA